MKIRTLRRIVGTAIFLFLSVIIGFWMIRPRAGKGSGSGLFPDLPKLPDWIVGKKASLFSNGFIFIGTEAGRPLYRLMAEETVAVEGGWLELRGVKLTLFGENGRSDALEGDRARFQQAAKKGEISGHVRLFGTDGTVISTEKMEFDSRGRIVSFPEPIRAVYGTTALEAMRGEVDSINQRLSLQGNVLVRFSTGLKDPNIPERQPSFFHAVAESATLDRRQGSIDLEKRARIVGVTAWLQTEKLHLDQESSGSIRSFFAEGEVRGLLGEGALPGSPMPAQSGQGHRTSFACDRLEGAFDAESGALASLAFRSAAAGTLLFDRLDHEASRRLIARELVLAFSQGELRRAESRGGVDLTELPEGGVLRTVAGDRLESTWSAGKNGGAPDRTEVTGPVSLSEGQRHASGERLVDRRGEAILEGSKASYEDDRIHLTSPRILYRRANETLRAEDEVHGRLLPDPRRASSPFSDSREPLFWSCKTLDASNLDSVAILSGDARMWQGEKVLKADRVTLNDRERSVICEGSVRAIIPESATSGEKKGSKAAGLRGSTIASGGRLVYREADATVVLSKSAALVNIDRRLSAEQLMFCLDRERNVERVLGDGMVEVVDPSAGRKGGGDSLDYRPVEKILILESRPPAEAWVEERGGNRVKGSLLIIEGEGDRVRVRSAEMVRTTARIKPATPPSTGTPAPSRKK